MDGIIWKKLKP